MARASHVDTLTDLTALVKAGVAGQYDALVDQQQVSVAEFGGTPYVWGAASTATVDSPHVVAADESGNGRWVRQDADGITYQASSGVARSLAAKVGEIVSVKDFGAVGDGVADDTAAVQAAVDTRKPLFFPAGKYRVTSTIVFPTTNPQGSGGWCGEGAARSNPQTSPRVGPDTSIIWDGDEGGDIVELSGQGSLVFEKLAFVGRPTNAASNRAARAIFGKANVGFGGHSFTQYNKVHFFDFDIAIQLGEDADTTNMDVGVFIQVYFENCDSGMTVKHFQGISFNFYDLTAYLCKNILRMERGGHVLIEGTHFGACGGDGADDWCFSFEQGTAQNHSVIINNMRVELGTKKLIRGTNEFQKILLNGFSEAQTAHTDPMFSLRGTHLTVTNAHFFSKNANYFVLDWTAGNSRPSLLVGSSSFAGDTFRIQDWITFANTSVIGAIRIEGCFYRSNHTPLPTLNSAIEWGEVTSSTRTTNASQVGMHFNGVGSGTLSNLMNLITNGVYHLEWSIAAVYESTNEPAGMFMRRAFVKVLAGTVSIVGSVETIGTDYNPDGLAVDIGTVSTTIRPLVTGLAATNIQWSGCCRQLAHHRAVMNI